MSFCINFNNEIDTSQKSAFIINVLDVYAIILKIIGMVLIITFQMVSFILPYKSTCIAGGNVLIGLA